MRRQEVDLHNEIIFLNADKVVRQYAEALLARCEEVIACGTSCKHQHGIEKVARDTNTYLTRIAEQRFLSGPEQWLLDVSAAIVHGSPPKKGSPEHRKLRGIVEEMGGQAAAQKVKKPVMGKQAGF